MDRTKTAIVATTFVLAAASVAVLTLGSPEEQPAKRASSRALPGSTSEHAASSRSKAARSSALPRRDAARSMSDASGAPAADARAALVVGANVAGSPAASDEAENEDDAAYVAQAIRDGLENPDPEERVDAIRVLTDDNDLPDVTDELAEDLERLALSDPSPEVRRFAAQALALASSPAEHLDAYRKILADPDWTVRANGTFGIARTGDEQEQANLLQLLSRLRTERPELAEGIERAVESPELSSPTIVAHFKRIVDDPSATVDAREHASEVLASKETR